MNHEVLSYDDFEFETHNSNGLWQLGVTMIQLVKNLHSKVVEREEFNFEFDWARKVRSFAFWCRRESKK